MHGYHYHRFNGWRYIEGLGKLGYVACPVKVTLGCISRMGLDLTWFISYSANSINDGFPAWARIPKLPMWHFYRIPCKPHTLCSSILVMSCMYHAWRIFWWQKNRKHTPTHPPTHKHSRRTHKSSGGMNFLGGRGEGRPPPPTKQIGWPEKRPKAPNSKPVQTSFCNK